MVNSVHSINKESLIVQPTEFQFIGGEVNIPHESRFRQAPIFYIDGEFPPVSVEALALDPTDTNIIPIVQLLLREGYRDHGADALKSGGILSNHGKSRVFYSLITNTESDAQRIESTMGVAWGGETETHAPHTETHYLTVAGDGRRFADIVDILPKDYIEIKGLVTAHGVDNPLMMPMFIQLLRGCRDWGEALGAKTAVALMNPSLASILRSSGVRFLDVEDLRLDWNGQNLSEDPLNNNSYYFMKFFPFFKSKRQLLGWLHQNGITEKVIDGSLVTPNTHNILLFRDEVEANWNRIRVEVPDRPRVYSIDLHAMKGNLDTLARHFT